MWTSRLIIRFFAPLFVFSFSLVHAQVVDQKPPHTERIDIIEHLGAKVPLELVFRNEDGDSVRLGQYFGQGKPVLLSLVYYECPMLCTFVLNGLVDGVRELTWKPGEQFQMVSVSIDPRETPKLAADKKLRYLKSLGKDGIPEQGWAFLVDVNGSSQQLADAIGFKYFYDAGQDQYAHPAAAYVLAEDGTISRYLYGLQYKPQDLRLSLLEASEGKIGNTLDRLLLYCFHYDPDSQSYVLFAQNLMRLGGGVTLVALVAFLAVLWMRDRVKRRP